MAQQRLGSRRRYKCGCTAQYMHVDYEWRGPVWAVIEMCARHQPEEER